MSVRGFGMVQEPLLLGWDLGTSGVKAVVCSATGTPLRMAVEPYPTYCPSAGYREQEPEAWWAAIVKSTRRLLGEMKLPPSAVQACALSGHSLGVVPLDHRGRLLAPRVPIWSDERAKQEADQFFERVDETSWYLTTGNGFPRHLYAIFKMMWYKQHIPQLFARTVIFLGTKDYINYRLTGEQATDRSYASGSGVYSLQAGRYVKAYVDASGVGRRVFPDVAEATSVIGHVTPRAARDLGLPRSVAVVAGGVDNACMALGAMSYIGGRTYASLGSSSWVATSSSMPLLDSISRPYVFAHVVPDQYTSALSIFASGTALEWVLATLCSRLSRRARRPSDRYPLALRAISRSPRGANGLLFDPALAGRATGGSTQRQMGALMGIDLSHGEADILRATFEGIALGLRSAFEGLRHLTQVEGDLLVVGGGSQGSFWRQILADVLGVRIVRTCITKEAAALGAAALAAVGCGLWTGFDQIDRQHKFRRYSTPDPKGHEFYDELYRVFLQRRRDCRDIDAALACLGPMAPP